MVKKISCVLSLCTPARELYYYYVNVKVASVVCVAIVLCVLCCAVITVAHILLPLENTP
jgi:hypothetical protein